MKRKRGLNTDMARNVKLKEQAVILIDRLPKDKLQTAIDFLAYLQDRDAWEATLELTNDPEIMASLRRSEEDIQNRRVKNWKDIRRNV
jgi:hypothetical protein